jgi:hypothetical protein
MPEQLRQLCNFFTHQDLPVNQTTSPPTWFLSNLRSDLRKLSNILFIPHYPLRAILPLDSSTSTASSCHSTTTDPRQLEHHTYTYWTGAACILGREMANLDADLLSSLSAKNADFGLILD